MCISHKQPVHLHPHHVAGKLAEQDAYGDNPTVAAEEPGCHGDGIAHAGQEGKKGQPIAMTLHTVGHAIYLFS